MMAPNSSGNDVERSGELAPADHRAARPGRRPASRRAWRAQASRSAKPMSSTSASVWIGSSGGAEPVGVAAVDDQRGQARREDDAQVGEQAIDGSPSVHCRRVQSPAMRFRELNVGCFGGGTGLAELAGRSQAQPVAEGPRRRHDVRQRRQFRASCATSWACCRRATCSSARWRCRRTRTKRAACCWRACRCCAITRSCRGTPAATCCCR